MSRKLNILMSHKNNFYSVTINEFLMFQKQAATLEFFNNWRMMQVCKTKQ